MATIKVAGIQISIGATVDDTLRKVESWIESAESEGAELVCLPELFANEFVGREIRPDWKNLSQTIEGPLISRMRRISDLHNVGLLVPFYERDAATEIGYNSAAFIRSGRVLATYRKTYIPESSWNFERYYFSPGSGQVPVVEIADARFAAIICYDRHFPELARMATFLGAQVLMVPTASADRIGRTNTYQSELVGLAAANGIYVVGVNRVGREGSTSYFGGSCSIAPDGTVVDQLGDTEGLIWCEVDTERVDETRRKFGHLRDVRKDVLRGLADLVEREEFV